MKMNIFMAACSCCDIRDASKTNFRSKLGFCLNRLDPENLLWRLPLAIRQKISEIHIPLLTELKGNL